MNPARAFPRLLLAVLVWLLPVPLPAQTISSGQEVVPFAAALTFHADIYSAGRVTLTGNVTSLTLANGRYGGQSYLLVACQGTGGPFTVAGLSANINGALTPNTTGCTGFLLSWDPGASQWMAPPAGGAAVANTGVFPGGVNTDDTTGLAGLAQMQLGSATRPIAAGHFGIAGMLCSQCVAWAVIPPNAYPTADSVLILGAGAGNNTNGYYTQARLAGVAGNGPNLLSSQGADASFNSLQVLNQSITGALGGDVGYAGTFFTPGVTNGQIGLSFGAGCHGHNGYDPSYDGAVFTLSMTGSGNSGNTLDWGLCGGVPLHVGADGSFSTNNSNFTIAPDGRQVSQSYIVTAKGFETVHTYTVGASCNMDSDAVISQIGITNHGNAAYCKGGVVVASALSSDPSL